MIGDTMIKAMQAKGMDRKAIKKLFRELYAGKITATYVAKICGVSNRLPGVVMSKSTVSDIARRIDYVTMSDFERNMRDAKSVGCHVPDTYGRKVKYCLLENGDIKIVSVEDAK